MLFKEGINICYLTPAADRGLESTRNLNMVVIDRESRSMMFEREFVGEISESYDIPAFKKFACAPEFGANTPFGQFRS